MDGAENTNFRHEAVDFPLSARREMHSSLRSGSTFKPEWIAVELDNLNHFEGTLSVSTLDQVADAICLFSVNRHLFVEVPLVHPL